MLFEVVATGLVAAVLAVPIGFLLASVLVERLSAAWFTVEPTLGPADIALLLGPTLVLLPLAGWPALRAVMATSMVQSLRERMTG